MGRCDRLLCAKCPVRYQNALMGVVTALMAIEGPTRMRPPAGVVSGVGAEKCARMTGKRDGF